MAKVVGSEWYEKGWWVYITWPAPGIWAACACEEATLHTVVVCGIKETDSVDNLRGAGWPNISLSPHIIRAHFVQPLERSAIGTKLHAEAKRAYDRLKRERTIWVQYRTQIKLPKGAFRREPTGVTFMGFTPTVCKTHPYPVLRDTVYKAADHCANVWRWRPTNLRVLVHASRQSAMGLAFDPISGDHRISLAQRLLQNYTLDSIYRVVLHELCHHYRGSALPGYTHLLPHDTVFCRELAKVDPMVSPDDVNDCTYFLDEIMEDAKAVVEERARKADADYVLTTRKTGRKWAMSLRMIPAKGRARHMRLSYGEIKELVKAYGWDLPIKVEEVWQKRLDLPENITLETLIRRIVVPGEHAALGLPERRSA